ncbi:leucine-rich repeat domain, L domain-like protein [Artemisia annua]|uniref:Leucine-rich repeat domain, L domain-like protein n=1 Tax=Artemisia annua TaxID=35608 RepID=A0A2U1KXS5_ARTAN|nr:leucine-rich repeat domain, L domain-like protein [Artemisia annua]
MGFLETYPNAAAAAAAANDNIPQYNFTGSASLEYTTTFQYVINMDLSNYNLVGEIPVELMSLSALLGLNLSNNHLNGGIPDRGRESA